METNIAMVKGDTFSFGMELEDLEQDLDTAYLTVKESYDDVSPVFQKSIGDGITKVDTGEYTVRIAPEDTENIEARRYVYDLQIGVNSDIFTILRGILWVKNSVTE